MNKLFDRNSTLDERINSLEDIEGFSCVHDTAVAEKWFDNDYEIILDARKAGYVKITVFDPDGEEVECEVHDSYNSLIHDIKRFTNDILSINESNIVRSYNVKLDEPFNNKLYTTLLFKKSLEKGKHYFYQTDDMGRFGFTVNNEIKPNDLNFDDYEIILNRIENINTPETNRLVGKIDRVFRTGRLIPLTKDEVEVFLDNINYGEEYFYLETEDVKTVVNKLIKKYRIFDYY